MQDILNMKKKLRTLMIIMVVAIIPGLVRVLNSPAFESVRSVDIVTLFVAGMATGVFITTLRSYNSLKDEA